MLYKRCKLIKKLFLPFICLFILSCNNKNHEVESDQVKNTIDDISKNLNEASEKVYILNLNYDENFKKQIGVSGGPKFSLNPYFSLFAYSFLLNNELNKLVIIQAYTDINYQLYPEEKRKVFENLSNLTLSCRFDPSTSSVEQKTYQFKNCKIISFVTQDGTKYNGDF